MSDDFLVVFFAHCCLTRSLLNEIEAFVGFSSSSLEEVLISEGFCCLRDEKNSLF